MAFSFFGRKKNDDKTVTELPTANIVPNRFQPRKVFQEDAIKELAATIKDHGLLQPIIVREYEPGQYEIIAGERRFRAVTSQLHWDKIPAIVTKMADDESAAMAIIENLQRAQLSPVEEARAYADLMASNSMTQENLARRIGKSQSFVANKLRLLKLSEDVQSAIMNGAITERHGRELLKLTPKQQSDVLRRIARDNLTVKETAQLVRGIIDPEGVRRDEEAHAAMAARVNAQVAADETKPAPEPDKPAKKKPAKKRTMPLTKDTRLAVNTIKKSVKMVRETGMQIHVKEDDDKQVHRIIIEIPNEK
ncbi:ParB/RepB/Spo0J family partition protein [Lacticaseibacillus pabuli]|uniref:ParB/RepB/Spo0J family partition protein n=1 Tax=Lacticaseibacillus pabuli TaxID=3025672 RepID=A0ABY7WRZ5_9LACO|nr:ParB/RepB/Spo0J family partition protein [Lacticaseibacillus sp. KACC 23028]WDF82564.1 ParB/RepB/Spo0J family partition protein [Lacticaseibacillus sp. KACC 23028]